MLGNDKDYCQNSSDGISKIGVSQCYKGEQEVKLTVIYNDVEEDTLRLCKECADRVEKDAKKHDYEVERRRICYGRRG